MRGEGGCWAGEDIAADVLYCGMLHGESLAATDLSMTTLTLALVRHCCCCTKCRVAYQSTN